MLSQTVAKVVRTSVNIARKAKSRLLIVSDEPNHLKVLQSELGMGEVEITNATTAEEVRRACRGGHDLAVVDVEPGIVVDVLETLRGSEGYSEISVLVNKSRLGMEPSLAGVLPAFRAMPCSSEELVRLARHRVTSSTARLSVNSTGSNKVL
jgi:DNA-binding NtrC family response regulator